MYTIRLRGERDSEKKRNPSKMSTKDYNKCLLKNFMMVSKGGKEKRKSSKSLSGCQFRPLAGDAGASETRQKGLAEDI